MKYQNRLSLLTELGSYHIPSTHATRDRNIRALINSDEDILSSELRYKG